MSATWHARFVSAWREDKALPFGPLTRLETLWIEASWQLHCAQMASLDEQLSRFSNNITGFLGGET